MKKVGVIGAGYWGPNLIRNFSELGVLSGVCDYDREKLKKIEARYNDVKITTKVEDLFEISDGIVIATGGKSHYQLAKLALEHDKDVFVEKPLALNLNEGKHLVEIADERGLILMVGHLLLYHPGVKMLKEYLNEGTLGTIRYIYSQRVNLGRIRTDENALWSFGPHDVSVILYLLKEEPSKIIAIGESYIMKGIPDVVFLALSFPGGIFAHIHLSWLDPHKVRKFTIVGDKKMAVFDDMETEKIRLYDKGVDAVPEFEKFGEVISLRTGDILIPNLSTKEPLSIECKEFTDCMETRKPPLSDGKFSLKVLRVLEMAQKSLDSGGGWVG